MKILVKEKHDGTEAIYENAVDVYRTETEQGLAWQICLESPDYSKDTEGVYATFHMADWEVYILKQ